MSKMVTVAVEIEVPTERLREEKLAWVLAENERLREALTPEAVATALQGVWTEWVLDTGETPGEFMIHGPRTTRVSADFREGNFADLVSEWLMAPVLEVAE